MNLIKSISNLFAKKNKNNNETRLGDEGTVSKSVELNVPNAKVKRRKQKRGY